MANFGGGKAAKKARVMAESILARTRTVYKKLGENQISLSFSKNLDLLPGIPDFEKTHVQILGAEDSLGGNAIDESRLPRFEQLKIFLNSHCEAPSCSERPCCGCQ